MRHYLAGVNPTIYLAGSWKDRCHVAALAERLAVAGFLTVHPWWTRLGDPENYDLMEIHAIDDLAGVKRADVFVLMQNPRHTEGKAFELGYAYGIGKPTVIYRPNGLEPHSIFEHLRNIDEAYDFDALVLTIQAAWRRRHVQTGNV
jgi:nucleoside 2-deoxyribosyltransferase